MGTMSTLAGDLYAAGLDIPADPAARAALVAAVLPLYLLHTTVAAMPQPSRTPEYQPASAPDDDGALLKWEATMWPGDDVLSSIVGIVNDIEHGGALAVEIRPRRDAKGRAIGLGLWVREARVTDADDATLDLFRQAADGDADDEPVGYC